MAGLEPADLGSVSFFGEDVTHRHIRDRGIGFVFQHYALFRHMTVLENIAFGLKARPRAIRPSPSAIKARVGALLELVQMTGYAERYPAQLSGGQRQRVALARALAPEPRVLLLDEPFGALDANVRSELRNWLRRMHDEFEVTSVLVTHDQEEALEVADRIVILNKGRIEQSGPPSEVYHSPSNPFVCSLLGRVNILTSRGLPAAAGADAPSPLLYVRPHDMDIWREPPHGDAATVATAGIAGTVTHVNAAGPVVRIEVRIEHGARLEVELSHERHRSARFARGDRVFTAPRTQRMFGDGAGI
jgi:sulfate transport system ATP-binding protein